LYIYLCNYQENLIGLRTLHWVLFYRQINKRKECQYRELDFQQKIVLYT